MSRLVKNNLQDLDKKIYLCEVAVLNDKTIIGKNKWKNIGTTGGSNPGYLTTKRFGCQRATTKLYIRLTEVRS